MCERGFTVPPPSPRALRAARTRVPPPGWVTVTPAVTPSETFFFLMQSPARARFRARRRTRRESRIRHSGRVAASGTQCVLQLVVERDEMRADSSSGCDGTPQLMTESNKLLLRPVRQRRRCSDKHALPGATSAPGFRHLPLRTRHAHGRARAAEAARWALATGACPAVGGVAASRAVLAGLRPRARLVGSCRVGNTRVGNTRVSCSTYDPKP